MKNSVILGNYFGIVGNEGNLRNSPNHKRLAIELEEANEELVKTLNEHQLQLLKSFQTSLENHFYDEACHNYTAGYKLGLMTGIEAGTFADDWTGVIKDRPF